MPITRRRINVNCPIHGDEALGVMLLHRPLPEPEVPRLNPKVVLAALDDLLAPWTLHPGAEKSAMKYRIRQLRDQVAQYVEPEPIRTSSAGS